MKRSSLALFAVTLLVAGASLYAQGQAKAAELFARAPTRRWKCGTISGTGSSP